MLKQRYTPKSKWLTPTVWKLGLVSLFMDFSSEMLYPVMPLYLEHIGFSVLLIGILEGFAEGISGWSKAYFGQLSDHRSSKLPFVQLGYLLSAVSKPLLILFPIPLWVFFCRFTDRIGKGLRTAPRDALLSAEAQKESKGKVFGFHRAMDTIGAFIGPIAALIYLYYQPEQYEWLFLIAFAPGLVSVFVTTLIKPAKNQSQTKFNKTHIFGFLHFVKYSNKDYKRLLLVILLFTLFNSSDVFLLLSLKDQGLPDAHILGFYIFYNAVFALFAFPMGSLADRFGVKKIQSLGLLIFAGVYFFMAFADGFLAFTVIFMAYGIYAAMTEGNTKAWFSLILPKDQVATGIGSMEGFKSILTFMASSLAGGLWLLLGQQWMFVIAACGAGLSLLLMLFLTKEPKR